MQDMANPFLLINIQGLLSIYKINFQNNFFWFMFFSLLFWFQSFFPSTTWSSARQTTVSPKEGLSFYVTTIVGRVYWFTFPSLAHKVAAATRTRTAHVCCRCCCFYFYRHHNLQSIRKALEGSGLLLTNLSAQSESNSIIKCDRFQNYRVAFCVTSRIITLIFNVQLIIAY